MLFSDRLLAEADSLCEKCFKQSEDTMLCSGIRLFKRPEYKDVATPGACIKLRAKREGEFNIRRLKDSNIPPTAIEKYKDSDFQILTRFEFLEASEQLTESAWEWGCSLIREGIAFKYVLAHLLVKRYEDWDNLIVDLGDKIDVLFLDRFNVGHREQYISEALSELIRYRYNQDLRTFVTYEARKPHNTTEERLYEFLETWEEKNTYQ